MPITLRRRPMSEKGCPGLSEEMGKQPCTSGTAISRTAGDARYGAAATAASTSRPTANRCTACGSRRTWPQQPCLSFLIAKRGQRTEAPPMPQRQSGAPILRAAVRPPPHFQGLFLARKRPARLQCCRTSFAAVRLSLASLERANWDKSVFCLPPDTHAMGCLGCLGWWVSTSAGLAPKSRTQAPGFRRDSQGAAWCYRPCLRLSVGAGCFPSLSFRK
jgi:hypothetical protein